MTAQAAPANQETALGIIQDDHDLAQSIISGVRGYGVTIRREHSAVAAIAQHRIKYAAPRDDAHEAFMEALRIIAAGHGCPAALAKDVLERHPATPDVGIPKI